MQSAAPPMLKPTLIAGVGTALFASIPMPGLLGAGTCCLALLGCGFLAAFLHSRASKQASAPFSSGKGAVVGLVSAVFFSITVTVVAAIQGMRSTEDPFEKILEEVGSNPDIPAESMKTIEGFVEFMQDIPSFVLLLFLFIMWLIITSIFSTIGGAIGGAVFKVEEEVPSIQP
ncbi:MAG: hypothetical protein IFK94_02955 [Acidobacteria bacterium]|uniref:Uncharacterized protein n=1 Tax=Candidatus Polarisedimenticola svalbardensis TaxID=2886004 RepID=A0A8J6XXM3_9BACT|nr:hypothetical protein [Candidatus Polarisedimenticola svalbardensis]